MTTWFSNESLQVYVTQQPPPDPKVNNILKQKRQRCRQKSSNGRQKFYADRSSVLVGWFQRKVVKNIYFAILIIYSSLATTIRLFRPDLLQKFGM